MYFSQYLAAAVLAAVPSIAAGLAPAPWNNITSNLTTQTVTAYKTYIPTPTKFKRGNTTYTVNQKSWVTVTDCPENCTISFAPCHQQTVAPVTSSRESGPEAASSTGSSSSTGSTGSSNAGAGYSSGSSSSNSTGSGSTDSSNNSAGYSRGSSLSNSTGYGAIGSGNSSSTGSRSGSNASSNGSGFNGTGSTGTGSNNTGSTGSGFNGSGSTGNQYNHPAQTISSGGRLSVSLSGVAIAAICFIAL